MNNSRPHLLGMLAGLFLAAGLVLSSALATNAWVRVKNSQLVSVKGSARRNVNADLAVWKAAFSARAATLLQAQKALQADEARVELFLKDKAVTNYVLLPIAIEERKGTQDTNNLVQELIVGYRLTQPIRVESQSIEQILRLNRECSELVEGGILLTSEPPEFVYTNAAEAKIEMLAEATQDARARAEQIAIQGKREIDGLHSAEMGVFQITPRYDGQSSAEGLNDTTSPDKTITAVVTATFTLK